MNCIIQHCGSRWPGTDATVNADRDEERRWGWRTQDFPAITMIPIDPYTNAINISNNKNGLCDVQRQSQAKLTVKHFDIFPAEHCGDAFHQDQLVPICDIIWDMLQYFVNYLCIWIIVLQELQGWWTEHHYFNIFLMTRLSHLFCNWAKEVSSTPMCQGQENQPRQHFHLFFNMNQDPF